MLNTVQESTSYPYVCCSQDKKQHSLHSLLTGRGVVGAQHLLWDLLKSIQGENSFVNVTAVVGLCQSCTTKSFVELGRSNVSLPVMKRLIINCGETLEGGCPGYFWLGA